MIRIADPAECLEILSPTQSSVNLNTHLFLSIEEILIKENQVFLRFNVDSATLEFVDSLAGMK